MFSDSLKLAAIGAAFLGVLVTASTEAWVTPYRTTYLTFNRSVALPGVELTAGTYIFELASPNMDLRLVRVLSRDRSKVYLTAFTNIVDRPPTMRANQAVSFGEAPAAAAPPITAWFPVGENNGRQFIYWP